MLKQLRLRLDSKKKRNSLQQKQSLKSKRRLWQVLGVDLMKLILCKKTFFREKVRSCRLWRITSSKECWVFDSQNVKMGRLQQIMIMKSKISRNSKKMPWRSCRKKLMRRSRKLIQSIMNFPKIKSMIKSRKWKKSTDKSKRILWIRILTR